MNRERVPGFPPSLILLWSLLLPTPGPRPTEFTSASVGHLVTQACLFSLTARHLPRPGTDTPSPPDSPGSQLPWADTQALERGILQQPGLAGAWNVKQTHTSLSGQGCRVASEPSFSHKQLPPTHLPGFFKLKPLKPRSERRLRLCAVFPGR